MSDILEQSPKHWIVSGPGVGNIYAVAPTERGAIYHALSLMDEGEAWRLRDKLTARQISNPRAS